MVRSNVARRWPALEEYIVIQSPPLEKGGKGDLPYPSSTGSSRCSTLFDSSRISSKLVPFRVQTSL